jgi:hypothetical protein
MIFTAQNYWNAKAKVRQMGVDCSMQKKNIKCA